MVRDMPEPCKFPSLDSCQKWFLQTHKEVDLVPHPVVGLVLQVGDAEKFPQALGFKGLDVFFFSHQTGSMFQSHRGWWRWQETCTISTTRTLCIRSAMCYELHRNKIKKNNNKH